MGQNGESGPVGRSAAARLAEFFARSGYVRLQNRRRLEEDGYHLYKKGDEVRFVTRSPEELELVRELLRQEGFRPGTPYAKGAGFCLPLYGRRDVARFLDLVEAERDQT